MAAEQVSAPVHPANVDVDAAGDGGHEAYTNRELLQIISGRTGRLVDENEEEGLASLLRDHSPRFAALLSHYKPPSKPSLQRLKAKDDLKGSWLEFVVKAAGMLHLDELQCLEVVEAFLVGGYHGTVREFTQQLKVATQMHTLLHKVLRFYRNERIFLLQCVRHALTNALDPGTQHYTQFAQFVDNHLKPTLFDECWEQFETSTTASYTQHKHRTPEMVQESWLWNLQEQVELLKILHLCVALDHAPRGSLVRYAKFLNECHFGQQQDGVGVASGRQSGLLLQRIAHLSSTLLPLLGGWGRLGGARAERDSLQSEVRHLKDLVAMVMHSWGATPPHMPTMLHVAALHYALNSSSVQDDGTVEQQVVVNQVHQLVGRALEGGVLQYLRDVLTHDEMSLFHLCECETLHWVHRLLTSLNSSVGLDSLPCQRVLCDIISKLLVCKSVREEVWSKGLTEDLGMMLSIAKAAFPCTAAPLLGMLLLLAQDAEGLERVVALLDQMAYFAEELDMDQEDIEHAPGQEEGTLVCSVGKAVYTDSSLSLGKEIIIPAHTLGSVVQLGADGTTVVCWAAPYSAWDYLSLEAIHLYSMGHQFFGQVRQSPHVEDMVQNMTKAARLVGQLLTNDATGGVASKLHPLTSMFYHYLARFSTLPCPPLGLLAACLDCVTAQLEQQPETFWNHLIQTGFLPHRLALTGPDKHSAPIAPGHFGQLLASHEQPRGRYVVTMATLDCVHMVLGVESGVRDSPELLACVMYLMEEVVPSHHKWRYSQTGLIDRIALKLLDVISAALQLRDSPLGQYVAQCLLYTPTGISLLNHITQGAAAVETGTVSWHDSRSEQKVEVLKSTLSLVEGLLRDKQGQALSPLEEAFVHNGTGGGAGGGAGLLRALASLLYPHKDPELTTCAVRLVGKLCQDMPMSVYASLGEEAPAIRDTLVARLCAGSSPRELVLAILRFIAGAVGTQPGLMELFLALRREEGGEGESTELSYLIEPESCLVPVMDMLEALQDGRLPPDLASAVLGVLHALWLERKDAALIALRQRPGFWRYVLSPLSREWCVWYESEESVRQSTNLLRALTHLVGVVGCEAYYTARSFDKDFCDVFSDFKERYLYWTEVCGPLPVDSVSSLPDDHPGRAALIEAHCAFIESWTRFLIIAAKLRPKEFSLNSDLVRGVLCCTLEGMEAHTRQSTGTVVLKATAHLSHLLLVLVKPALESQRVSPSNEMVEQICQTFQHGWGMEDLTPTPPPAHTHLFAASIVLLKAARDTPGLLEPRFCLGFIPFIGRVLQNLQRTAPQQETELDVLAVLLLSEVVQSCPGDETVWLPVLRQHAVLLQVVHITDRAIRSMTLSSLVEACLSFLLTVANSKSAAKALVMSNIDHTLCLSLGNVLALRTQSPNEDNPMETNGGGYGNWRRVWLKSLSLVTVLLTSLGHTYVSAGVDFVGVYQEHISRALDISMATTAAIDLEEVLCAVSLVCRLTQFKERWQYQQPQAFGDLMRQSLLLCNSAVALLDNMAALRQACKLSGGDSPPSQQEDAQRGGSADLPAEPDDLQDYQWTMVRILDRCVVTLQLYSPTLTSLLSEGVTEQVEWMPLVALTFSSPQVGVVDPPSLGTLTCALDVGRALLKEQAERGSPSKCRFLLSMLEHVVMFLLSQSTCCLAHPPPALEGGRRELLARELASELETFLSGMSRYFSHRGGHSPAVVSLTPSPHKTRSLDDSGSSRTTSSFSESPDQGVFRLAALFVDQHLK